MQPLFRLTFFIGSLLSLFKAPALGQSTYCNPMDIDYKYNFEQMNEKVSYRSGADPVFVNHKGEYYLFVTISGGYWHSKDMLDWKYVTANRWPFEDMCAPAALSVHDTLFLFQSTFEQRPILYSTAPEKGIFEFYNRWLPRLPKDIGPWDPGIFHDEDTDKWFMYWGSSNVYPIFGAELDHSRKLTYKTDYKALFWLNQYEHGWERFGPNHSDPFKPFVEGAWLTKHKGRYYLQYGAPGTEYNVYANGTYVSNDPLGPFAYAPYNPIAYKPGGFATGAGHGSTWKDNYDNYWNSGTSWIGYNWAMERRLVRYPAGFDKDGQMFANTRFGDFPYRMPDKKWVGKGDELFTGWMLLSYKKKVACSSATDKFPAENITDENPRTFWVAKQNIPGETLTVDLEKVQTVKAVQVNYADYKSDIYDNDPDKVYTQFKILTSTDNKTWKQVADVTKEPKRDRPCAYIELTEPVQARYVRYAHVYVAAPNLAISEFRIFGNGSGLAPITPKGFSAIRQKDQRNVNLSWEKVPGALGYNVLWGIAPDKLYQTYQFWQDEPDTFELRALNVGVPYFFAIESFSENGVSSISNVVEIK